MVRGREQVRARPGQRKPFPRFVSSAQKQANEVETSRGKQVARIKSGARPTIRHMLSLSPQTVFSSRFVRVSISLPSPHPHCSRCSRPIIHPDATTGYPVLARVAMPRLASCHPSISVIIFMPRSPTLPTARISIFHVGPALLRLSRSSPHSPDLIQFPR